jgi:hypothetical protein
MGTLVALTQFSADQYTAAKFQILQVIVNTGKIFCTHFSLDHRKESLETL